MLTLLLPAQRLYTPEELVAFGFRHARVVMLNEAHAGLRRCVRTREVGRRALPVAHWAGVRALAVEALDGTFAAQANRARALPPASTGYLAQPDLRALLSDALDLGWSLIAYEANPLHSFGRSDEPVAPGALSAAEHDWLRAHRRELSRPAYSRWRARRQAANLCAALAALPPAAPLLIWCGNRHLMRPPQAETMAGCFQQMSGLRPFVIDQTVTVAFTRPSLPPLLRSATAAALRAFGGTAGYLAAELPWAPWGRRRGVDAWLVSLHNSLE